MSALDSSERAARCLAFIAGEEEHLRAVADFLQELRAALAQNGARAAAGAAEQQDALARESHDRAAQRERWRVEMGRQLGIDPQTLTLERIADGLEPADRQAVLTARARLRTAVERTDRLAYAGALLLRAWLDVLQQFFLDVTGAAVGAARYGPEGGHEMPTLGSLINARG